MVFYEWHDVRRGLSAFVGLVIPTEVTREYDITNGKLKTGCHTGVTKKGLKKESSGPRYCLYLFMEPPIILYKRLGQEHVPCTDNVPPLTQRLPKAISKDAVLNYGFVFRIRRRLCCPHGEYTYTPLLRISANDSSFYLERGDRSK